MNEEIINKEGNWEVQAAKVLASKINEDYQKLVDDSYQRYLDHLNNPTTEYQGLYKRLQMESISRDQNVILVGKLPGNVIKVPVEKGFGVNDVIEVRNWHHGDRYHIKEVMAEGVQFQEGVFNLYRLDREMTAPVGSMLYRTVSALPEQNNDLDKIRIEDVTGGKHTREEWLEQYRNKLRSWDGLAPVNTHRVNEMNQEALEDSITHDDKETANSVAKMYWLEYEEELMRTRIPRQPAMAGNMGQIPVDFMTKEEKEAKIKYIVDQLSELPEEMCSEVLKQVAEQWATEKLKNVKMPSHEEQVKAMVDGSAAYRITDEGVDYKGSREDSDIEQWIEDGCPPVEVYSKTEDNINWIPDQGTAVPGTEANYMQVVPGSQFYDNLNQIKAGLEMLSVSVDMKGTIEYMLRGIENSIAMGYKITKKDGNKE